MAKQREEATDVEESEITNNAENVDEQHSKDPYSGDDDGAEEGQRKQTGKSSTDVAADIAQIEALALLDPSIKDLPEYKNLMKSAEKLKSSGKKNPEPEEEDEEEEEKPVKKTTKKVVDSEPEDDEEEEEDSEEEGEDEEEESDNVFGLKRKKGEEETQEIEVSDELADFIEEKYAIKKVDTFFDKVDGWRKLAQEASTIRDERDDIVKELTQLPAPIKAAIDAVSNGKDYITAFNGASNKLDYNKDFDSQDKNKVVKSYFTEEVEKLDKKLEKGDIDDDDYNEKVELLYSSAKRLFNTDKERFNKQRADMVAEQEVKEKAFKQSAISSVEKLREEYPNFSRADVQRIRQRLVDGNVESIFYNKDGSYKENAAEMLAYAEYGKRVVQELLDSAEKRGESKANEKIVQRGNKTMKTQKTVASKEKKTSDAVAHLQGHFTRDVYE